MYLDPSVSINCKYKIGQNIQLDLIMNNIRLDLLSMSKVKLCLNGYYREVVPFL